jgi:hypothetical protein
MYFHHAIVLRIGFIQSVDVVVEMAKLLLTGSHHGALTDFHLKNDYRVIEFYLLINFKREKLILLPPQFQEVEVEDISGF